MLCVFNDCVSAAECWLSGLTYAVWDYEGILKEKTCALYIEQLVRAVEIWIYGITDMQAVILSSDKSITLAFLGYASSLINIFVYRQKTRVS